MATVQVQAVTPLHLQELEHASALGSLGRWRGHMLATPPSYFLALNPELATPSVQVVAGHALRVASARPGTSVDFALLTRGFSAFLHKICSCPDLGSLPPPTLTFTYCAACSVQRAP